MIVCYMCSDVSYPECLSLGEYVDSAWLDLPGEGVHIYHRHLHSALHHNVVVLTPVTLSHNHPVWRETRNKKENKFRHYEIWIHLLYNNKWRNENSINFGQRFFRRALLLNKQKTWIRKYKKLQTRYKFIYITRIVGSVQVANNVPTT